MPTDDIQFDPTWGGTKAGPDTRSTGEKILPNFLGGKSAPVASNPNAKWDNDSQSAVSALAPTPTTGNYSGKNEKSPPPTQQATMENITMKQLLQIFEAPKNDLGGFASSITPDPVKPSPVEKLPNGTLSDKPQIVKLPNGTLSDKPQVVKVPGAPVDPSQYKKTDPTPQGQGTKPADKPAATKPAGPSNFAKEFARQRELQGPGGTFEFGGKKFTTDLKGEKGAAAKPADTPSTNDNDPKSYPDTAYGGTGKSWDTNTKISKSDSMAQAQNDPTMKTQPDAKPTEVGASPDSGAAMPSDKVPDNVGPVVRTGTGQVLTTRDGTPVRSRSADEIEWQMKNPMQTYPGAEAVAKQKEQGEKNWKAVKSFLGFGDKSAEPAPVNELAEILRLSGLQLNEKAASKQQQKFMGMVHAMQKGEKVKGASSELKKAAKGMSKKDAKDFASTKHKGLPQKVTEGIMLEAGNTLEHIINKFKHETKNFLAGSELDKDLFEALFDYYNDNGEMPYGVAKARDGDPYQWIEQRLENELDMIGYQRMSSGPDNSLSELARLAGLHESKIDECGDMGSNMRQPDSFNVSTNMSSDGTKSINVSAQGDKADELMQMLKMAGMRPHDDHDHEEPEIVLVSGDDMMEEPELEEERVTQYANTPEEEYETIAAITRQGDDLNREKQQYSMDRGRDNPMAIDLEESLAAMLESIKVTEGVRTPEIGSKVAKSDVETFGYQKGRGYSLEKNKDGKLDFSNRDKKDHIRSRLGKHTKPAHLPEGGDPYAGIEAERPYKDPKTGKMITPPRGATMPPPDNEFPAGDKRNLIPPSSNPSSKGKK